MPGATSQSRKHLIYFAYRVLALNTLIITHDIAAHLQYIAVHIVQSPGVWLLCPNGVSGLAGISLVPCYPVQVGHAVSRANAGLTPGPAGIFPLRLGRQGDLSLQAATELFTKIKGAPIIHILCW